MNDKDVMSTLNDLIETCHDGEYGFREAAGKVDSATLRTTLEERSRQCASAARELQEAVLRSGGTPDEGGSATGALHRGWLKARSAMSANDDLAMLEDCERGEDQAMERYRSALEQELPDDARTLVQRQYEGVKRNHLLVRNLRDQARAAR
jgi:uncharacterized protein (TIGR02284 family)